MLFRTTFGRVYARFHRQPGWQSFGFHLECGVKACQKNPPAAACSRDLNLAGLIFAPFIGPALNFKDRKDNESANQNVSEGINLGKNTWLRYIYYRNRADES